MQTGTLDKTAIRAVAFSRLDRVRDGEGFRLSVRDDGHEAAGHPHLHGQGKKNMMMRADQIGARLTISSTNGYSVEVLLPNL